MRAGRRALRGATLGVVVTGLSGAAVVSAAGITTSTPDDPGFVRHQQWGLVQAGFPTAWCRSTGQGALIVALDTGVDAGHPDLAGKLVGQARVQNGALTTGAGAAYDDSGHGTHVAGIAVADTDNDLGVAGAAPGARLYAVKVLFASAPGQPEQGSDSDLVQAIDYAADSIAPSWPGPVVLNISIGAAGDDSSGAAVSDPSGDISAALDHAYSRGLGIALAAANTGTTPVGGAAVQDGEALSVGALAQNGAVAGYSPTAGVSIFAAGGAAGGDGRYINTGILSTWPHSSAGDYAWMAGTSMAAPHVAGALALLMSTGLSNSDAYARLLGTADAQRRMHVDQALGSTAPCGGGGGVAAQHSAAPPAVPARPPVAAVGGGTSAGAAALSPASGAGVASLKPPPSRAAVVRLAPASSRGTSQDSRRPGAGAWLLGFLLGLAACVTVWLALPRRLLLRVMRP